MNRKQWTIAGVILIVMILVSIILRLNRHSQGEVGVDWSVPVFKLAYCSGEQVKPCVVSFSTDAKDNMLVNLLLPDPNYPYFYLKIVHGENQNLYGCQRVVAAVNNAYCTGEKLPPGETLIVSLVSIRDENLLAEGKLAIIGLAYPTIGVVTSTPPEMAITELPATTQPDVMVLPGSTDLNIFNLPTFIEQPSYPNPSYPNPSYP